MPRPRVVGALSTHCHTVNFAAMGFSSLPHGVYDAATMRLPSPSTLAFTGTVAVLLFPLIAPGAQVSQNTQTVTLALARAVGSEAVTITGSAPASQPLEAALYARFSRDLPSVLLSRRPLNANAAGHYSATLSLAPAYFRDAVVTVVVHAVPDGPSAEASLLVAAPNVPAPPDDIPPSVR